MKNTTKILGFAVVALSCAQVFAATSTGDVAVTATLVSPPQVNTTSLQFATITSTGALGSISVDTQNPAAFFGATGGVSGSGAPVAGQVSVGANGFNLNGATLSVTGGQNFTMTTTDGTGTQTIPGQVGLSLTRQAGTIGASSVNCQGTGACTAFVGGLLAVPANPAAGSYSTANAGGSPAVVTLTYTT